MDEDLDFDLREYFDITIWDTAVEMAWYTFHASVVIVLWFLLVLFASENLRKSYWADIITSNLISVRVTQSFLTHKYHQLKKFTELESSDCNEKLNVLEVGVGEGTNFELFPDNCRLTALDYNEYLKTKFIENVNKYSKIEFDKFITGIVEDMHEFEDNTFDVVLCTHVLCCVPHVPEGLREIKRVLKERGRFFFVEHVAYQPDYRSQKFWIVIQHILEPFWKVIMGGCSLKKETWIHFENAGFSQIDITSEYPKNLLGIFRPQIWGCAVK